MNQNRNIAPFSMAMLVILLLLTVFIVGTIWTMIYQKHVEFRRDDLAEQVLPRALPAIIAAVQDAPPGARGRLSPFLDDLQDIAPMRIAPTEGGSALHWDPVQQSTCEQVKAFLVKHPDAAITLLQDGAIIAPGGYADMLCLSGDHGRSTLTFQPRS